MGAAVLGARNSAGDAARVQQLADEILSTTKPGDEDWVQAKGQLCMQTVRRAPEQMASCAEALLAAAPESPMANYVGVFGALVNEDFPEARARLEKARPAVPDEKYQQLVALIDEHQPFTSRWGPALAKVFVAWLAVFGVMALLGLLLSALTLSAAARLATERQQHRDDGAKALRAVYRLVMGLGAVFYYLSLPLIALSVIGVFGGLVYLCFAVGRIPIKLVAIAVVVGGASLFALVKSLFVRGSDEDPGARLDFAKAPKLKALVDGVAAKVGTRTIDTVFIAPGTELAVFERGPLLKRLRGQGERCLIIGRGVLDGFELGGFRSVLAHEFGHFSNQDTAGGNVALVARQSLLKMGIALAQSGAAGWYNPAWLFFRGYYAVYLRISQGASRLQEVLADRVAIFTFGSAAFASGYHHVITQSARFDSHVGRTIKQCVEGKQPLGNLYRFVPQAPEAPGDVEQAVRKELEREPEPFDSHPSPRDRLAWAAALSVQAPAAAEDRDLVLSLFDDLEALEREMTAQVRSNIAMNHEIMIAGEA